MKILTAQQMRDLDIQTQEKFTLSSYDLMRNAGQAMVAAIEKQFHPDAVCVVCGKGNNAGDGFEVAYQFHILGREVTVVTLEQETAYTGAALQAWQQLRETKVLIKPDTELAATIEAADIVIDALLGTGIKGPARDKYAHAIGAINTATCPIIAADVPSGLRDLTPNEEPGPIVKADTTLTVGLPKTMLLTQPGSRFAGDIITLPINFPKQLLKSDEYQLNWAPWDELLTWLPPRQPDSNKGTYGHVGIIGAAASYAGATTLVSRAALRTGCGLVTIYTLPALNAIYKIALPEATSVLLDSQSQDNFDTTSATSFADRHHKHTVLAVGPGLGQSADTKSFLLELLAQWKGPLVLDADALNILADGNLDNLPSGDDCLITPHPGEMARLTGLTVKQIQADRETIARDFAMKHKIYVLLKGADALVARSDGQVWLSPGAEPALAKGGSGDVLTGVIASLFAQGMPMWQAAVLGAAAHLKAGSRAARIHGPRGVLASDVADQIPMVL